MIILKYPNPKLKSKAAPIEKITPEILELGQKMIKTVKRNKGAGLAANQVGELKRLIIYLDNDKYKLLINPKIIRKSKEKIEVEEGCLSFPNLFGKVIRCKKVKVVSQNQLGKKVTVSTSGLLAVILQHEIDHLDGILFIDKTLAGSLHKVTPQKPAKKVQAVELKND